MLGHITRQRPLPTARPASHDLSRTAGAPRVRQSPPATAQGWGTQQRAGYYFDAGWHSAQTMRRLVRANLAGSDLGIRPAPELLARTLETVLQSIRPGLKNADDSRALFTRLLHTHLEGLAPAEIRQLSELLKAGRFECAIVETVIDDYMMEKFGFSNGAPNQQIHTLMYTSDLHETLDALQASGSAALQRIAQPQLSASQASSARDVIAAAAARQTVAGATLHDLADIGAQLADAVGLPQAPSLAVAVTPVSPATNIDWQGEQLLVDLPSFAALRATGDADLYAGLLRDLLEAVLARRLFGPVSDLLALSGTQRALLFREIEQVLSLPPTIHDPTASATAAALLKGERSFGSVQILPSAGARLGHAWIAPTLSVAPDRATTPQPIGTRFMRPGFRLEPEQHRIFEWDIRWLNAKENEALYPAERAWHLRVPAQRAQLQQAAEEIINEWQQNALPYRFTGTEPGMPATGCRMTVWHAVQRAMDDDTRTLFEHFRRGLPAPDSPTELALRLEQFMDWLGTLAAQPTRTDL